MGRNGLDWGALLNGSFSSSGNSATDPVAERQVLARNGAKPHVGFQVTAAGHFMAAIGVDFCRVVNSRSYHQ